MANYERTDEKTPCGGDYSEIYYFGDNGEPVDSELATNCIIRECKKDGSLLNETYARC